MDFDLSKKNNKVGIAIISVSCCQPGVALFEQQAKRVVEQAIAESGADADLRVLPVSTYFNSIPREVVPKLLADYQQGKISAPPILIDGKVVFYGVPKLEEVKAALLQAAETRKMKEGQSSEPATK